MPPSLTTSRAAAGRTHSRPLLLCRAPSIGPISLCSYRTNADSTAPPSTPVNAGDADDSTVTDFWACMNRQPDPARGEVAFV